MIEDLKDKFIQIYSGSANDMNVFFSPGRVNLIGEHTDYNGGYVFPCALSLGTYLVIRKRNDDLIKFSTTNFDFSVTITKSDIQNKISSEWVNYPLGIINQYEKKGHIIKGLELLYSGNLPDGAGLSSSASIELVTSVALNELFGFKLNMLDQIKLSQSAENEFVGVQCGIMDQFAVGMGKKDMALFLDCDTLDYELIPLNLGDYKLVIANTNKKRELADSKYNERVKECKMALEYLNKNRSVNNLGDLNLQDFSELMYLIPDEIEKRRAKHVISENQRVLTALEALKNNKLFDFGRLMNESHDSLKHDYEVTGFELDTLVDEARKIEGVIGARMTGAGFGGCTVNLVNQNKIDQFCSEVGSKYLEKTGLKADFYIVEIGDGARKLE